jgi:hypothetical protein
MRFFNPNHDPHSGKFATGNSGNSGGGRANGHAGSDEAQEAGQVKSDERSTGSSRRGNPRKPRKTAKG